MKSNLKFIVQNHHFLLENQLFLKLNHNNYSKPRYSNSKTNLHRQLYRNSNMKILHRKVFYVKKFHSSLTATQ